MRSESVGPDRKLAERLRTQKETNLNSDKVEDVERVTFDKFMAEEVEVMKGRLSDGSLTGLDLALRHFRRICEPGVLADIKPRAMEAFLAQRLQEVRPATANKDLRTVKASFGRGVRRGYLRDNPANHVKQVREPEKAIRVLTGDEVSRLMRACPCASWRALVALAVTTGMRVGELMALRWCDVDLEQGLVHVLNTEHHLTKSRRNRTLALLPEARALLAEVPRRGELVLASGELARSGSDVQRTFRGIVRKAGIAHCTLHDLRRTFVSQLAMAGVNAAVVQKLAGHSSISTTIKHYTGIMPDALRAAQARLPLREALRDVSFPCRGPKSAAEETKVKIVKLYPEAV
jgi:integrase